MNRCSTISKHAQTISGRAQSARLLIYHALFCVAAVVAALIFRALNLHFYPCMFYVVTSHACLSCGATRAVFSLLRFDIVGSFLNNPLPLLFAALMATVMGFELTGVILNRRIPFRWIAHCVVFIVGVLLVYAVLRFVGVAPNPV